jgi:hypothetical protein
MGGCIVYSWAGRIALYGKVFAFFNSDVEFQLRSLRFGKCVQIGYVAGSASRNPGACTQHSTLMYYMVDTIFNKLQVELAVMHVLIS